MFKRPHHQRIARLLQALDSELLTRAECYFGGGTAIVLALDEYRESVDVDFLCASAAGYRELRNRVFEQQLSGLTRLPLNALRELRTDQYGIRTFIEIDGIAIKFEIIREARISLTGSIDTRLGVPTLSCEDMYAEKLLANADRHADISTNSRDIIDLAMMINSWGPIPEAAWTKVHDSYGAAADGAFSRACERLRKPDYLESCLVKMKMNPECADLVRKALDLAEWEEE